MFVQYFTHAAGSLPEVEQALLGAVGSLPVWAEGAYRSGEELRVRVGPGTDRPAIAKTVRLQVGEPFHGEGATSFPITWEATGTPGLFPAMSADLVLAPLGPELTQVKFRGTYEPPLGVIGQVLDRYLFHRVTEASVKNLVDRVVAAVSTPADDAGSESANDADP